MNSKLFFIKNLPCALLPAGSVPHLSKSPDVVYVTEGVNVVKLGYVMSLPRSPVVCI